MALGGTPSFTPRCEGLFFTVIISSVAQCLLRHIFYFPPVTAPYTRRSIAAGQSCGVLVSRW